MAQEVVGRRDLAQPPVDDHADAVGERGRVAEVVGHDDRREPQLGEQVLEVGAHARARVRVERRQRLVEQQDAGVARERAGERDALALAARDVPGLLVREVGDAEALEQPVDARSPRPRRRRRSRRTVMCGNSAYSWKTRPTDRASGGRSTRAAASNQTSSPSAIRPRSGRRRPAIARSTVLLPAPDGPTRATVSAPTVRRTASSYDRRAQAMSSSSVSTTTAFCRTAGRSR